MKTTILATAALTFAIASPALAQSFGAPMVPGNLDTAAYARVQDARIGSNRAHATRHRAARRSAPFSAYGQSPLGGFPLTSEFGNGVRWPGAKYDADGRYIDQNSPGRW